ncbi:terminase small subunit [Bacillus sp. FSL K6-3431]|uniref:terminase small subunit n=1 Tax=Bacillus sp. FSL K6-3431 TaxID=2921500 RepID=UPI0030F53DB3
MKQKKLTPKQQAFSDYYIELGNATEAYLKAYPNVKKEATARANGSRLLTYANISSYIAERMEELKSERVADQQEIMETLTAVLRGEADGAALVGMGMGEQYMKKDMKPTVAERIKAAELIGKRYALWTDKQQVEGAVNVTFIDDIGDEDEA